VSNCGRGESVRCRVEPYWIKATALRAAAPPHTRRACGPRGPTLRGAADSRLPYRRLIGTCCRFFFRVAFLAVGTSAEARCAARAAASAARALITAPTPATKVPAAEIIAAKASRFDESPPPPPPPPLGPAPAPDGTVADDTTKTIAAVASTRNAMPHSTARFFLCLKVTPTMAGGYRHQSRAVTFCYPLFTFLAVTSATDSYQAPTAWASGSRWAPPPGQGCRVAEVGSLFIPSRAAQGKPSRPSATGQGRSDGRALHLDPWRLSRSPVGGPTVTG
jgi:hypothetical protein